jgi:hypothetical protein
VALSSELLEDLTALWSRGSNLLSDETRLAEWSERSGGAVQSRGALGANQPESSKPDEVFQLVPVSGFSGRPISIQMFLCYIHIDPLEKREQILRVHFRQAREIRSVEYCFSRFHFL